MPERKYRLLERIAGLVGEGLVTVIEPKDGWPGFIDVQTDLGLVSLAAHVGTIGRSHRDRDSIERRFQNPGQGKPISSPEGRLPVLLGLWEEDESPVLVALDAKHRIGKETRQSLFTPLSLLLRAQSLGWAEQYSSTDEQLIAFHPAMLPVYAAAVSRDIRISPREVQAVLNAAGLGEADTGTIAVRARRATTQLVRDAEFGHRVCDAYGSRCAMCGFNFSLVQGAHIHPASAPDTSDAVWNGLSLCYNHHAAFDRHRIFVDPESRRIRMHPDLLRDSATNEACRSFVANTYPAIVESSTRSARARPQMFERRYTFFRPRYKWAGWK